MRLIILAAIIAFPMSALADAYVVETPNEDDTRKSIVLYNPDEVTLDCLILTSGPLSEIRITLPEDSESREFTFDKDVTYSWVCKVKE